ncbi:glycoprotein 3-alpha-L-fucosyltransferase [Mytilus galloprovincialis]|uniref:Fucosyltransferase n=1 Tax=Mytilus galloprovincialis TaxID=29158 RepID=A0A8B6GSC8_MYTGA|nr:glycoprotein 3-alpha-L-fucosyltransferase [Mytilus galloprovincialis]
MNRRLCSDRVGQFTHRNASVVDFKLSPVSFKVKIIAKNVCKGVLAFLFLIWMIWTLGHIKDFERIDLNNIKTQPRVSRRRDSEKNFTILFYAKPSWFNPKTDNLDRCYYRNCELTVDKMLFSKSEAVIFHHNSFATLPDKPNGQVWIFVTLESPYHTSNNFKTEKLKMKFNWTLSYRKDSDGFSPYAVLRKQLKNPVTNYTAIFTNKTKNIAWVVSHCRTQSKREAYVKELVKYIDVDIYGGCGKPCPSKNKEDCKSILSKTYKFYLSFENSLCKDYLTEKIFTLYRNDMNFIPIVRGAPNAGDYLPPNTYVSTSEFKSPQQLAAFLKEIGNNKTRYISYLKEKDKYFDDGSGWLSLGFCDICYHMNVRHQKPKIIDINKWLWENQCHNPNDLHT